LDTFNPMVGQEMFFLINFKFHIGIHCLSGGINVMSEIIRIM